jgi:hypothetical protein
MKFITKKSTFIITLVILASSITSITVVNKLMSSSQVASITTNGTIDKQSSTTQSEDIDSAQKLGLGDESYRLYTLLENGQSTITGEEYYYLAKKVEKLQKYNTDVLGEFDGDCQAYSYKMQDQQKLTLMIAQESTSIVQDIKEYELKEANPEIKASLSELRNKHASVATLEAADALNKGLDITIKNCLQ